MPTITAMAVADRRNSSIKSTAEQHTAAENNLLIYFFTCLFVCFFIYSLLNSHQEKETQFH